MANFKKALEALAQGGMNIEALSAQLKTLLEHDPQNANDLLYNLEQVYEQQLINNKDYSYLKGQINQYRREHPAETDRQSPDIETTMFDPSNQTSTGANDVPTTFDDVTAVSTDADGGPTTFDDVTEISTYADGGPTTFDDVTEISTYADSTQVMPTGDNDKTQVSGDTNISSTSFDVTGNTDTSDMPIDISSALGADDWGTITETSQITTKFGPGSIIKQRFKLIEVLGIGGMGKVYKALDLLKEEARDKKPYVAIKLLNEDFKDHPEAFISLQRESSRQQKLAHPNIATIYDFDRVGGPGTPVFITMELMEGMELKDHIKKYVKKKGGLPFDEAFIIIEQLVAGLSYAHERQLVHSDFKPGNCFLCNDGTVKTLDFGIARAVKNPVTGEAEKTLFDPGQLGALTPAYASLEMLEGEEPDTRDDIYALGCVSYELLTGRHPFNKVPANKAKANNLKPLAVKGIKKKQNLALQRSVAFFRKDRSPTVQRFLTELEAKYIWYKSPITIAAIIFLATSIGATGPALNYFHQKKIEQFVTNINAGDPQIIAQQLTLIDSLEKTDQRTITDDSKTALQNYFSNRITKLIDPLSSHYNFPKAETVLAEAEIFYPDSNFIKIQAENISVNKKQQLSKLYSEFSDALTLAKEHNDASALDHAKAILGTIKTRIDADDSLITDARTSNRYRLLALNALDLRNYEQALQLISSGLELASTNEQLLDTKTKIQRAINISELELELEEARVQLASLQDYQKVKNGIIELSKLDPTNSLFTPLAASLREIINQELGKISTSGERTDAETLANEYGSLLRAMQLNQELLEIKLVHLSGDEREQVIQQIIANNLSMIEQSIQSAEIDNFEWESNLLSNIRELESMVVIEPVVSSLFINKLNDMRQSIAALYIDEAQAKLDVKRFDTAKNIIARGKFFVLQNNVDISNMETAIVEAEASAEKQLLVDGLIKDFRAQIAANQVSKALEYYETLKSELPEDNVFITTEALALLSSSYAYLAENSFASKDFVDALRFADKGLEFNPDNRLLKSARAEYVVETNIIELAEQFKNAISFDIQTVQRKVGEISSSVKFSEFRQNSIETLANRINSLKQSNENVAARLARDGAIFFPGSTLDELKDELQLKPWPDSALALATLNKGELTLANTLLQKSNTEFPDHPDVDVFSKELQTNMDKAKESFTQYLTQKQLAGNDYGKLGAVKRMLLRAQSLWVDNPDYNSEETALNELIAANKPVSKRVIGRENVDLSSGEDNIVLEEWEPIDSGRKCEGRLAGYGKRSKAICYDFINNGWRGPLMVVIPTSDDFGQYFAISKYEISVGDYGKYCAISKSCVPEKNKEKFNDPLTMISLEQAKAYAKWVTERTGKIYRLPTIDEWEYAANANGQQPRKDYNCRVALGDKIVKGTGISSVKSGTSNGWGLKNYIGNVQEWVIDNNKTTAKGGAFQDAHSKCSISFSREHNGQSDEQTGFRLLLEDVG